MEHIPLLDEIAADRIAGMLHYADAYRKAHPADLEPPRRRPRRRRLHLPRWLAVSVHH